MTLSGALRPESPARTKCLHCALPVPRDRHQREDDFCCDGCRLVYALIREEGLERYYDLRSGAGTPAAVGRADGRVWLDRLLDSEAPGDGPRRVTLDLQGLHCAACVWLIQELFRRHDGGVDLRINPALGKADLTITRRFDIRSFVMDVERFGYRFGPDRKPGSSMSRGLLVRMGVSAAAAMNVMIFSATFYSGLGADDGAVYRLFGLLNFGLTTMAVLVGGSLFFHTAWQGLRRRIVHLDLPIALGIGLAYLGSILMWRLRGPEAAYFDTVCVFITLMLVGRWLQERVLEKNRAALLAADGVDGLYSRRLRNGELTSIPVSDITRGDELWIVPGDLVPVAGRLVSAEAEVALDWITGEPGTQSFGSGARVPAGAWNAGAGTLRLHATEHFQDSRLNELLRAPRLGGDAAALDRRHPVLAARSRFAALYVAGVLLCAGVGFAAWCWRDMERAILVTVSILVVTCPCALGLATPLAHELTHWALRRRGVFLREGSFLEKSTHIRKIAFDKTGTLTHGTLRLSDLARAAITALSTEDRFVLWNLVVRSNHPASRCLAEALSNLGLELDPVAAVAEVPGSGLVWETGRHTYRLGARAFALGAFAGMPRSSEALALGEEDAGVVFSRDGRLLAVFPFEEELKSDAEEELHRLRGRGLELYLLSGDRGDRARRTGRALGFAPEQIHGGLSPEGKAEIVRRLDRSDTLVVGDGLNDAPSFDVAFAAATPAVDRPSLPGRADFYFLGDGIGAVRRALDAAVRLREVLRGNLALTLSYNALAVGLCLAGWVHPLAAALLMPASSITVVGLTVWRLSDRGFRWMS